MGYLFCLMGKSSSGKDTIYERLIRQKTLSLQKIIPYTTRPAREGEKPGETYFFCTEEKVQEMEAQNQIIELRSYDTIYGIWKYFTANDGQINLENGSYLLIGTLDTYKKIRYYFGVDYVVPIYIEVEDGERLQRALNRERAQKVPKYEEMCRRFLADQSDFSEDKIKEAGIGQRFCNKELEQTLGEICSYIQEKLAE